ncbi:hypothetical protein GCM10027519_09890 [Kineococcus endophyticus]
MSRTVVAGDGAGGARPNGEDRRAGAGYDGRTGVDPAITGEPPEERVLPGTSLEPDGCGP